jgi:serine/threonine protein kinase
MGTVYKAHHIKLDMTVAVKVVRRQRLADASAVNRFEREMKATGKIRHPNIVRALDAGEEDGRHYLVMEYVDGVNPAELVKRRGPLSVGAACEIVRQAAVGLQAVHEAGLVHRDVKPSNLMLARDGQVKVLDLGLARFETPPPASKGGGSDSHVMGTAEYIAPEQVLDTHEVDIRADIYALGCTLYYLLTGRAPFSRQDFPTSMKCLMAHVHEAVTPIQNVRQDVPPGLAAVVNGMLSKRPEDRPPTPGAVAELLGRFAESSFLEYLPAESESLEAHTSTAECRSAATREREVSDAPPRKPRGAGRLARRLPWVLTIAVAFAGLMALGIIVSDVLEASKEHVLPNGWRIGQPSKLVSAVNRRFQPHEPSLTADGLTLYFATWVAPSLGGGSSEIFQSHRPSMDAQFGEPTRVGVNSTFNDTCPHLSADGLTLVFASNRPGGVGNKDLWISTRRTIAAPWDPPVNLGPPVNSSHEDWKPALSVDGLALVFASRRPEGLGLQDLWMCTRPAQDAAWSVPVNLGSHVNSADMDTSPCLSADKLALFFHRIRPGTAGELMMCTRSSVDADFGDLASLGPLVNQHNAGQVFITPDSHMLYYTIERNDERDIYVVPIHPPQADQ